MFLFENFVHVYNVFGHPPYILHFSSRPSPLLEADSCFVFITHSQSELPMCARCGAFHRSTEQPTRSLLKKDDTLAPLPSPSAASNSSPRSESFSPSPTPYLATPAFISFWNLASFCATLTGRQPQQPGAWVQ